MKTTYFKPSIHGWPFLNSFKYSFFFDSVTLTMGFCGGMCWRALQRFYSGTCIPRDTPAPSQGDALYDEIFDAQKNSLPIDTLWQIYRWQQSPDLSHWNRQHSLGYRTQQEWPHVKDRLDKFQPVTLTLITSSNDYNLIHLEDNHRVIAYAFDERPLEDWEWVHPGDKNDDPSYRRQIGAVDIFIYDPNWPDYDDVCLTFYTGCDDSWIGLKHSEGDEVHGFFLDDKDRSYSSAEGTIVRINKCEQTGISSATLADYNLTFSWQCRFIPYFCIKVDGEPWKYNSEAQSKWEPKDRPDDGTPFANKQCPSRTDSNTIRLKLPRACSTVAVQLLDSDDYCQSVEVDARPAIDCYPYVRKRAAGYGSQVCDVSITDDDLFIKELAPTQAAVEQMDTSPFRWIIQVKPQSIDTRGQGEDLYRACVEVIDSYHLGNIRVPILANFVERNLAPPTTTSGIVTIKYGQYIQTKRLETLASQGQKIFDGFTNNPADYDNDATVEFTYKSIDRFNVTAQGQATFYGRSIIYSQSVITVFVFDPGKVAKLEAIARDLIERGLIDIAIKLPQLQPKPIDPVILLERLRSHRQLQGLIDKTLKALWSNSDMWKEAWKRQSEILMQVDRGRMILINKLGKGDKCLKAAQELKETEQRRYNGIIIELFVQKAIEQFRRNPNVIDKLKSM